MTTLKGTSLVGGGESCKRVKNDFYATSPQSVKDFLEVANIRGDSFYEPCVGQGHIAEVLKDYFPKASHTGSDLIDRGYPNTKVFDFLDESVEIDKVDWIVTNPPFKLAKQFIERSLKISNIGVAMFLKIQFLESVERKEWLKNSPLKYVYVFSKRQASLNNGKEINPSTGKKWANTMCYAFFVWEIGNKEEPRIRWI